jgi:6-phosphogluconolactonase (cycloisomerase 2 family)
MRHRPALAIVFIAFAALVGGQPAAAGKDPGKDNAVFVQTNEVTGNRIVVYDRHDDGTLTPAGAYPTGGLGGAALPGTESDRVASQGSLVFDRKHELLIAVNAGSDTVSTFHVDGDALTLANVVTSGGHFPASIAVHDHLVYVLNAGGVGSVQGFRMEDGGLAPIAGSARSLGLGNTNPPGFLTSPGQVGFTPDGEQLLVTTKASTSAIDVFQVQEDGLLSPTFVANPSATPVPFAFTFAHGRLVSGEAGASSVTTYRLGKDGTLSDALSQTDGQGALCWIQRVGRFFYVSNTGSNTLSSYTLEGGRPILLEAVAATTEPGPIDLTSPGKGSFLYAETGGGTVAEFRVNHDGTLRGLGAVTGLPAGIEGIAST